MATPHEVTLERLRDHGLESFRRTFRGTLHERTDAVFSTLRTIDNGRVQRTPAVILRPFDEVGVQEAVTLIAAAGVDCCVRGGGHSYAGYSSTDSGVVIDLGLMTRIEQRDDLVLHLDMGLRWREVYAHLRETSPRRLVVGGGCDTVGVPGFLLAGGFSYLSRSYGLGSDNVLELTIITADGSVRQAAPDADELLDRDLFWACRGGGGGNFGVVTAAQVALHRPTSEQMLVGVVYFELDRAVDVLHFYDAWAPSLPDAMAVYGYLGAVDDTVTGERRSLLRLQVFFNGEPDEGWHLVRPLLELGPASVELGARDYYAYVEAMGRTTAISGRRAYSRSGMMRAGGFGGDTPQRLREHLAAAPSDDSFLLWMHQGGHTNTVGPAATAFPHRSSDYVFEVVAVWDDEAEDPANIGWAYDVGTAMRDRFEGAYVGYIDPLEPEWARSYYGANAERLAAIRAAVDPHGVFAFQQNLGSTFTAAAAAPAPSLEPLRRTHL